MAAGTRREIPIPEGWYYWTHSALGGKDEIIRDGQGRVLGVTIENHHQVPCNVGLSVTIRRKQNGQGHERKETQ
jgi:hypothetical protein